LPREGNVKDSSWILSQTIVQQAASELASASRLRYELLSLAVVCNWVATIKPGPVTTY